MAKKQPIDMAGQIYNRLTVLKYSHHKNVAYWVCRCECGTEKIVQRPNLLSGATKSCGCYREEHKRSYGPKIARHGCSQKDGDPNKSTGAYRSWSSMHARCHSETSGGYSRYGARGIIVCDRWHTFENFLADMGERPQGHTIDRYPNPHGDYNPANCRWATRSQQQRNRRDNIMRHVQDYEIPLGAAVRGV